MRVYGFKFGVGHDYSRCRSRAVSSSSIFEEAVNMTTTNPCLREELYFQNIHKSIPMIHQARYMAATGLELGLQPPIYLRHALLALGACASTKYASLQERFYR